MIRLIFALVLSVTLAACSEDGPAVSRETSSGGISYTLIHSDELDRVAISVAWPSDWAYREGVNQAAPYVGAQLLLAGGAEGFPVGEARQQFDDLRAQASLMAGVDHIVGHLIFDPNDGGAVAEIVNAHLTSPRFDAMWFGRIRDEMAQNIRTTSAEPANASFNVARWAVFGDQPLRAALSLDEPEMFGALEPEDVVMWHAESISRTPDSLVVAGPLNAAEVSELVDSLLDGLPDRTAPLDRSVTANMSPRRILLVRPESTTTHLSFIGRLPATQHGQELEDILLIAALGTGDQSVLFEIVRSQLRASYSFNAVISNYTRDIRIFAMTGALEPGRLVDVETAIRSAYDGFREAGPGGNLEARKAPFALSFAGVLTSAIRLANATMQSELDGFPEDAALRLSENLAALTMDDLHQRVQSAYPVAQSLLTIAVSGDADSFPGACVITEPREAENCP